jgi:hypothetical protein
VYPAEQLRVVVQAVQLEVGKRPQGGRGRIKMKYHLMNLW